jgi:hypothetical protein
MYHVAVAGQAYGGAAEAPRSVGEHGREGMV